jgi:hypothetical protein
MFGMFDQLHRCRKLLVALSTCCVRFHFVRELAAWIPAVHFVARDTGDSLAGLA